MSDMGTQGGGEGPLQEVLDQAWYNVRHHDALRLSLVRLYMIFTAGWVALVAFEVNTVPLLPATLFIVLYGWMIMRIAVRYKERIVRDMRVVYGIHERLFSSENDTKLIAAFKDYRHPRGAKKAPPRLSSTRHLLLMINLINALIVGWTITYWTENIFIGVGAGAGLVLLQEGAILLSKRHLAFNI